MPKQSKSNTQSQGIPPSEWIAASAGAALLLASIAILVYSAATSPHPLPRLSVRVASIEEAGEQYLVMIEVSNEGGSTAAEAPIEAELGQHGQVLERSEVTIDFVPPKSKRQAGVFFRRDPKSYELTLRISGYREP
jgi:uncharacterized protein (TIGR02588 family)